MPSSTARTPITPLSSSTNMPGEIFSARIWRTGMWMSALTPSRSLASGLGNWTSTRKVRVVVSARLATKWIVPWTVSPVTSVALAGSPIWISPTSRSDTLPTARNGSGAITSSHLSPTCM
jgi:hypothetical protein